jgi:hypothetical protein
MEGYLAQPILLTMLKPSPATGLTHSIRREAVQSSTRINIDVP